MRLAQRIQQLREKRFTYGISQNKLATDVGISRQYLSEIETGKVIPSESLLDELEELLERYNPDLPLEMFHYVRIRFPTTDPQKVIEPILKLKMTYMLHEDYAFCTLITNNMSLAILSSWSLMKWRKAYSFN